MEMGSLPPGFSSPTSTSTIASGPDSPGTQASRTAAQWAAAHCAAVLLAWVPGESGPEAIVDVLVGDENPGGKLPISIPRHVGQVPVSYRHHPTGGRSNWKGAYVDGPA